MSIVSRPTTADELLRMPDDRRRELVRGEVREMSPAGAHHGLVASKVSALLTLHVAQHRLGAVFAAETGFVIARYPDTVRAPDCSFVRQEKIDSIGGLPIGYFPMAPDLAVEVLSPNDASLDVEQKIDDWLNGGSVAVLVLNPRRQTATLHTAGHAIKGFGREETIDLSFAVPGFLLPLAEVFPSSEPPG